MNSFKKKKTSSTVTNPVSHPFENRLYHPIKFPKEEVLFAHGKRNGFALKLISYLWINSIQKSKKDCVFNQQIILR